MNFSFKKIITLFYIGLFFNLTIGFSQEMPSDSQMKATLRVIGHQLLLHSNDSTSLVLPVEKENERYKIHFETDLQFDPNYLVNNIDSIIKNNKIAKSYLVEVEECETKKIVYSYQMGWHNTIELVPCRERVPPKNCYALYITILELYPTRNENLNSNNAIKERENTEASFSISTFTILGLALFILIALAYFIYFKRNKSSSKVSESIPLGRFLFDKRNMTLTYQNQIIELSSKESDLLAILQKFENETVERDVILNVVWGDEGDYIGRTLDVFISKLRKKIEADATLKIVNIRGVGYKLVVN
ncbi:response regulator transcription factor [Flavobacterium jejuense]|uniref:Response regulator transcription factor n=1 Tax=Flavobacterium jejuense TaxID=1544455 RepID=A0ABX0IR39_9FLAO|nr:winged helix-turn-helix domain-containing protein [Flavobacterium jejuense]NHN24943.1 response regulator transcription factor [Flavobacterium jejuense]